MGLLAWCLDQSPCHELAQYLGHHPPVWGQDLSLSNLPRTPSSSQTHHGQAPFPRAKEGEG